MVTIKDVAERAGVAKSTVSNALTGNKFVSEELKQKILDICEEMNYYPSFYASRISGNQTNIIALFLEESENGVYHSFYTELIESALKYLSKHKYILLISYNADKKTKNTFLQKGKAPVDGAIIMAPTANRDERISMLSDELIPCVTIGRPDASQTISYVDIDNIRLVQNAVNMLAVNGYKKIYLLNASEKLSISQDRSSAFLKALEMNSLDGNKNNIFYCVDSTAEEGRRLALDVIEEDCAFVTANTRLADGVYRAAREMGFTVGKNIGVFALGGKKDDNLTPNLTYASQDYSKLARMAAKNLLRQIERVRNGENSQKEVTFIPSKIFFDSSINRS